MWQREGQKLASTNPRFVARQLTHLPHLLTSAAVSSALSLQSARADPELRKNTSAQVQNVLKYIISQNPLNASSGGAKQPQLGKTPLPTGMGKPLVKSLSKLPAVGDGSPSGGASTASARVSSAQSVVSSGSPPTKKPSKSAEQEVKLPPESNDVSAVPSPAKPSLLPAGKPATPTPEKSAPAKSTKTVAGGKSSMLVDLLGGKVVSGSEEASDETTEEKRKSVCPESESAALEESVGEKVGEKSEKFEEEEREMEGGGGAESAQHESEEVVKDKENQQPAVEERDNLKEEKETAELNQQHKEGEEVESMEVSSAPESGEKPAEGSGPTSELVCEEVMPKAVQTRDDGATSATEEPAIVPSSSSEPNTSSPSADVTDSAEKKERQPSPPATPTEQQNESSEEGKGGGESKESLPSSTADSEGKPESRKRPHPSEPTLPPSPKKAHLSTSSPSPSPPSSTTHTSLSSVPQNLPLLTTPTSVSVAKPTGPPPLLFNPPTEPVQSKPRESEGEGKRRMESSGSIFCQVDPGAPLGRVGGVTIQHLLPSTSLSLPSVCVALHGGLSTTSSLTLVSSQSPVVVVQPLPQVSAPPPPLFSLPPSSLTLTSQSFTRSLSAQLRAPPSSASLLPLPQDDAVSLQESAAPHPMTPITSSSQHLPPSDPKPAILGDVMMTSSTSAEALIRELCLEAAEDTTAAALASPLGLEFLEPNLLGGLDLIQLVNSPLQEMGPSIAGSQSPLPAGPTLGLVGEPATPGGGNVPDTSQLLSEALTSLSNPSTPLLPSSFPPFHPPFFSTSSPLVSAGSPAQHARPLDIAPSLITHSLPLSQSSPFTPHTPSLSSPLTPEILPDIENLASANEADILEGIPPELAKTIQALAQFESPM